MALPAQVQAQAAAADAFDKSIAPPAPAPAPVETPPADPPLDTPAPVIDTPPPDPAPPKPVDDPKWEHKFKTLQGMYNQHVPQLQQAVKNLTKQIEELKAAPPAPTPPADDELVTEKDREAFGADLVDLARRVAREEFGKKEKAYKDEIVALKGQLSKTGEAVGDVANQQQQSAFNSFLTQLAAKVPDWESLQATEECQEWLGTRVTGTEMTWDDALKRAANRQDVTQVAEIFEAFKAKHPKFAPPPAANPRAELERHVAPPKSRTNTQTPPAGKRTYTSAEYAAESMKQIRLEKEGKYEAAQKIEAELSAALMENRVSQ